MNCYFCGRFISYSKPYYSWSVYGGPLDLEPSDPEYAHQECYDKQSESEKNLIKTVSWIKPYLVTV